MKRVTVLADSAPGAPAMWRRGTILPYVGDSSVFVDQEAQALAVLDPSGRVTRTIAPLSVQDLPALLGGAAVGPPQGFDARGRLVYSVVRRSAVPPTPPRLPVDSGNAVVAVRHDTAAIVRADLTARHIDTVAFLGLPVSRLVTTSLGRGRVSSDAAVNPMPSQDAWALLPDGTVAVVRAGDYHIDWVSPDGVPSSTAKMPFDWRHLSDGDKQALIDSARNAFEARSRARGAAPTRGGPPGAFVMSSSGQPSTFVSVELSDMPDYYPAIRPGAVHADRDGNIWIVPTTSMLAGKGLVYDVVNRKGEVFVRVQVPPGRTVIAFGAGGVVYMASQYAPGFARLERAQFSR